MRYNTYLPGARFSSGDTITISDSAEVKLISDDNLIGFTTGLPKPTAFNIGLISFTAVAGGGSTPLVTLPILDVLNTVLVESILPGLLSTYANQNKEYSMQIEATTKVWFTASRQLGQYTSIKTRVFDRSLGPTSPALGNRTVTSGVTPPTGVSVQQRDIIQTILTVDLENSSGDLAFYYHSYDTLGGDGHPYGAVYKAKWDRTSKKLGVTELFDWGNKDITSSEFGMLQGANTSANIIQVTNVDSLAELAVMSTAQDLRGGFIKV